MICRSRGLARAHSQKFSQVMIRSVRMANVPSHFTTVAISKWPIAISKQPNNISGHFQTMSIGFKIAWPFRNLSENEVDKTVFYYVDLNVKLQNRLKILETCTSKHASCF